MDVYHSVIESSKTALVSMESIIKGMSQRVQSGALLLGLSAWHLYPDMVVHGSITKKIQQSDQLVPTGTIVTLGLESVPGADMGVYWSLPLAHLRFYGDPVQSIRSTGHDASLIPAEQLIYVVLGVIFRNWVKTSSMIHLALRWLSKIHCCIKRAAQVEGGDEAAVRDAERTRKLFEDCRWLKFLLTSVESFNKLQEHEREVPIKLMATGFRRFQGMLDKENPLPLVFGLLNVRNIFPLLRRDMVEERIRILRRVAAQQKASPAEMIIRYKQYASPEFTRIREDTGIQEYYLGYRKGFFYEYASALPFVRGSTKRDYSGKCSKIEKHKRWTAIAWAADLFNEPDPYNEPLPSFSADKSCACIDRWLENLPGRCSRDDMHFENAFDDDYYNQDLSLNLFGDTDQYDGVDEGGVRGRCACPEKAPEDKLSRAADKKTLAPLEEAGCGIRATEILATGEDCVQEDPQFFEQYYNSRPMPSLVNGEEENIRREHVAWESKHDLENTSYLHLKDVPFIYLRDCPWGTGRQSLTLIYGDEDSAALYRVSPIVPLDYIKSEIEIGELESLLGQDALDVGRLINHIGCFQEAPYNNLGSSLKAFASFINVYRSLPEATIALKIANMPLHEAAWVRHAVARKAAQVPLKNGFTEIGEEQIAPQKHVWSWYLSLAETFACIAMFESGTYDLDPSALEHVFAMSSSNSLFVAAPFLNDPGQRCNDCVVLRVVGNIGRAGIAILIAPPEPRIRRLESDT